MKAKKLLAGVLTCVMVFAMGMTAFAADDGEKTYTDTKKVKITKSYELENVGTKSPAEDFYLIQDGTGTVTESEATTAPDLEKIDETHVAKVSYAEGDAGSNNKTKDFEITLPNYDRVGIYTYTLKEVVGNTAGVTYRTKTIKLVVTVINDENGKIRVAAVHTEDQGKTKTGSFDDNKYSAGTLNVTKTVGGELGDKTKKFSFTVKFKNTENKNVNSTVVKKVANGTTEDIKLNFDNNGECEYTFELAHGEQASFANLPYGVSYEVTETPVTGYTMSASNEKGSIESASQTAAFTNTKGGEVDTGINLTSLPYMLTIAGIVVIAAIAFVVKRRRFED